MIITDECINSSIIKLPFNFLQETSYQVPIKRLRLVKKPTTDHSTSILINHLDNCKTSNDALVTLLRISDNFDIDVSEVPEVVKKLAEHFKIESESAVRVKILSLLSDIGQEANVDVASVLDETILLLKNELSHKVIAQGLNTILKLGKIAGDHQGLYSRLIEIAKTYLKDVNHYVKCKCLEIIGAFTPVIPNSDTEKILQLVCSYHNNDDARVRSQAFSTLILLHERGLKLNPDMYSNVCAALRDDYEIVRRVVLKLICLLGNTYPDK